jgi:DNA repair protein RadC
MAAEPRKQFRVLFQDKRNRLFRDEVMGWGTVDHAPSAEPVRRAMQSRASEAGCSLNAIGGRDRSRG